MPTRRLLFVRPRMAGLAPIYAALLALVAASVLAFIVALWPQNRAPATHRLEQIEGPPVARASEGGLHVPPDAPAPRRRGTWL